MSYQGTYGYYWSSTAYSSATSAYRLNLNSSGGVYPAGSGSKYDGFSLRCLAETQREALFNTHYPNYTSMTDSAGPEFVLSGNRNSTSMYRPGTRGGYWSSTAYPSVPYAYLLYLDNSGAVSPANGSSSTSASLSAA